MLQENYCNCQKNIKYNILVYWFISHFAMVDNDIIIILSSILFFIGFVSVFGKKNPITIIISIESMFLASILNFCYSSENGITTGYIAAIVALILNCLNLAIILFLISNSFSKTSLLHDMHNIFDQFDI